MKNSKASNLFLTEFAFKCPKNWFLVDFQYKKVTSFKNSLLSEFVSELFESFELFS